MDEQKKLSDIEEAAAALIANSEDENPAYKSINKQKRMNVTMSTLMRFSVRYKDALYFSISSLCSVSYFLTASPSSKSMSSYLSVWISNFI